MLLSLNVDFIFLKLELRVSKDVDHCRLAFIVAAIADRFHARKAGWQRFEAWSDCLEQVLIGAWVPDPAAQELDGFRGAGLRFMDALLSKRPEVHGLVPRGLNALVLKQGGEHILAHRLPVFGRAAELAAARHAVSHTAFK